MHAPRWAPTLTCMCMHVLVLSTGARCTNRTFGANGQSRLSQELESDIRAVVKEAGLPASATAAVVDAAKRGAIADNPGVLLCQVGVGCAAKAGVPVRGCGGWQCCRGGAGPLLCQAGCSGGASVSGCTRWA